MEYRDNIACDRIFDGMEEDKVFQAYSDESGINVGDRYTSVSVVSGEADMLSCLRDRLGETLEDKKVKEVKFFDIKGYRSPITQAAIRFIECTVNGFAVYGRVRVDTITTYNKSLERDNYDFDNKPDLERMYYVVLADIVRRWGHTKWGFYPDMNSKVDWSEIVSYLNRTRLRKRIEKPLLIKLMLDENPEFEFFEVKQVDSVEEPLVQLADLFAGMAKFSHDSKEYDVNCAEWLRGSKYEKQGELIKLMRQNNWNIPRRVECRYRVIGRMVSICHRHRLYVSINSENHLRTRRPANPINFWPPYARGRI